MRKPSIRRTACLMSAILALSSLPVSRTADISQPDIRTQTQAIEAAAEIQNGQASNGTIYQDGKVLASGYAEYKGLIYKVENGQKKSKYTGILDKDYVSLTKNISLKANHYYYKNGEPYTGIYEKKYYHKGAWQSGKTGWKKYSGKLYYIKKGTAVTGSHYLKSYSGGSNKYKYTFNDDGSLVTNLFKGTKNYNKNLKKKMRIEVNLTTHNTTFYLYDKKSKKYDIPAYTAVCSTSKTRNGTKVGNYRLEKTSARKWFIYKKSNPYHYYLWGVHIKGHKSWFHSTMYKTKNAKNIYSTGAFGYNRTGTDQTTNCIRHQAGVAKLIYDISKKTNPKERVKVRIFRKNNNGPFGKVTLKDTTGSIGKNAKFDPTNPTFKNKKKYYRLF